MPIIYNVLIICGSTFFIVLIFSLFFSKVNKSPTKKIIEDRKKIYRQQYHLASQSHSEQRHPTHYFDYETNLETSRHETLPRDIKVVKKTNMKDYYFDKARYTGSSALYKKQRYSIMNSEIGNNYKQGEKAIVKQFYPIRYSQSA